jgi:ABC-2 type transport system permease protein
MPSVASQQVPLETIRVHGQAAGQPAAPRSGVARVLAASAARGQVELKQFFRSKDAVVFTLAMPAVLLIMLASIFGRTVPHTNVKFSQVYTTGLLAGGVASTCFLNLAVAVAGERENGALKRLAGTPMPKSAYFLGKAIQVLTICVLETAVLLVFGHFAYGVSFPNSAGHWFTFIWVTILGAVCMALVGVAFSSLPRSARSAAPVANLPLLVLQFISGIFVPFTALPKGLYNVAGIFPLRWIAQGYRSALLPSYFTKVEPTHGWDHVQTALVLGAWSVLALAFAVRTFRWTGRGER